MQLRKQNAFFFLDFMIEYEHKKHINQIKKEGNNTSNNAKFCEELECIVDEMFEGKK